VVPLARHKNWSKIPDQSRPENPHKSVSQLLFTYACKQKSFNRSETDFRKRKGDSMESDWIASSTLEAPRRARRPGSPRQFLKVQPNLWRRTKKGDVLKWVRVSNLATEYVRPIRRHVCKRSGSPMRTWVGRYREGVIWARGALKFVRDIAPKIEKVESPWPRPPLKRLSGKVHEKL